MRPRLLRSDLTGSVYVVTRYVEKDGRIEAKTKHDVTDDFMALVADNVNALDLHKERIRRLQEALCECQHREFFQSDLHDEACPVFLSAGSPKETHNG